VASSAAFTAAFSADSVSCRRTPLTTRACRNTAMTITSTTVNSVTSLLAIHPASPASLDRVVTRSRCTANLG
jgi:hypothetical protein